MTSDTMKVRWDQPVEAVYPDGKIGEATVVGPKLVRVAAVDGSGQGPWNFNNDGTANAWLPTIRNKPAAAVGDIVWGDPIEVGGVRPAWLGDGEFPEKYQERTSPAGVWHNIQRSAWSYVNAIRLPANHPYYTPETPETPAEAPLGVLTGVERLERLEALTARLAAIEVRSFHGDDLVGLVHEARGLVVDPDLLKAREVCNDVYADAVHPNFTLGRNDGDFPVRIALAAIKRGRSLAAGDRS